MSEPPTPPGVEHDDSTAALTRLAVIGAGSVLIAALISPAITSLLINLPDSPAWLGKVNDYIRGKGYASVFARVVMVSAVIGVVLSYRVLGLTQPRRFGLIPPTAFHRRDWLVGFAIAMSCVLSAVALKFAVGEIVWSMDPIGSVIGRLFKGAFSAVLIGAIEETIFRGLLLGALYRKFGAVPAMLLGNIIFSGAHCMQAVKGEGTAASALPQAWWDLGVSVRVVEELLGVFGSDPQRTALKFFALFLFGLLTSYAAVKRRSLYLAMGLHAGTVFILQIKGSFRDLNPEFDWRGWSWLLGEKEIVPSVLAQAVMLLGLVLTVFWTRRAPTPQEDLDSIDYLPAVSCSNHSASKSIAAR